MILSHHHSDSTWAFRVFRVFRGRSCTIHYSLLAIHLSLALALAGCVTKGQAQAQARAAYLQGQREAEMRSQQQARLPMVTVVGQVRNPAIHWTEDLTLAKAILAAGYQGRGDPAQILIVRNGVAIPVDPKTLLDGQDVPLQANDTVVLKR